ncbi:hypothetical protein HPB50_001213 [Hyalomma asiaticum]|uniref:Uncharacterized protein n=1 Tax=Hyalomma asiaticum TaxID=266040 RepID=A0ACB7SAY0_HYAAI|nr:hypothetical protein HPB50_001213 [Hyalomma asiaticum]
MAADSADFQRLYKLSRLATNRQQSEAAVRGTAAENPAATTSQANLICFDECGATHEAHPPAQSVFEGARHITPSLLPELAEDQGSTAANLLNSFSSCARPYWAERVCAAVVARCNARD